MKKREEEEEKKIINEKKELSIEAKRGCRTINQTPDSANSRRRLRRVHHFS